MHSFFIGKQLEKALARVGQVLFSPNKPAGAATPNRDAVETRRASSSVNPPPTAAAPKPPAPTGGASATKPSSSKREEEANSASPIKTPVASGPEKAAAPAGASKQASPPQVKAQLARTTYRTVTIDEEIRHHNGQFIATVTIKEGNHTRQEEWEISIPGSGGPAALKPELKAKLTSLLQRALSEAPKPVVSVSVTVAEGAHHRVGIWVQDLDKKKEPVNVSDRKLEEELAALGDEVYRSTQLPETIFKRRTPATADVKPGNANAI